MSKAEDKLLPSGQVIPGHVLHDPSKPTYSLQKLAKEHTEEALKKLVSLMRFAEDESVQLQAANAVLDRGWGKASVKVEVESERLDLPKMQEALLQTKAYVDAKIEEAMRLENEQLARYIADDAEIVEDSAPHCEAALQDNAQRSGDNSARLHIDPAPDLVLNANASREAIYGAYSHSQAPANHGDNTLERNGVQDVLRYSGAEDAYLDPQGENQ